MGIFHRKKKEDIHKECWALNYYFILWLYEHLKVYKEDASKMVDLTFHKYQYEGKEYTFAQLLDEMIILCEYVKEHFYEWEEEVKEKTDKLLTLFSLTFHSFWW